MNEDLAFIIGSIVTLFFVLMFLAIHQSICRAKKNKPYSFKHGMYLNKDGELIATKTEIMTDPKTGICWYGKTK